MNSITNKKFADNDIKMMEKVGSHSNIVSYYGKAEDKKFVLVSVERCKSSLHKLIALRDFKNDEYKLTLEGFEDLVLWKRKKDPRRTEPPPEDICIVYPSVHLLKILRGIVSGLCRLHSLNISHNNLKIQNVLINRDTTVVDTDVLHITAKLSNFSLSTIGVASSGGQEPTFPRDLIDLGDLLLDCIAIPRAGHTKKAKVNWLKHLPEAHDLITQLQNQNIKLRSTAAQVKMHPFFWEPKERLRFLYYASECIKKNDQESEIQEVDENMYDKGLDDKVDKEVRKEIESIQASLNEKNRTTSTASDCVERENRRSKIYNELFDKVDYKGWDNKVGEELVKQMEARKVFLNKNNNTNYTLSYHGVSLLKAIRNHYIHLPLLPEQLRIELGETLTQIDDYFSSRFPKLLMQVYNLFKDNPVNGKTIIDEYFELWEIKVINA